MPIRILSRIPASALRRPVCPASRNPHRFYPIDTQSLAERKAREVLHD